MRFGAAVPFLIQNQEIMNSVLSLLRIFVPLYSYFLPFHLDLYTYFMYRRQKHVTCIQIFTIYIFMNLININFICVHISHIYTCSTVPKQRNLCLVCPQGNTTHPCIEKRNLATPDGHSSEWNILFFFLFCPPRYNFKFKYLQIFKILLYL